MLYIQEKYRLSFRDCKLSKETTSPTVRNRKMSLELKPALCFVKKVTPAQLSILKNFTKYLFYRTRKGNCL